MVVRAVVAETGIVAAEEGTGGRGGDGARGWDGGGDPAVCIARREFMRARSRFKAI